MNDADGRAKSRVRVAMRASRRAGTPPRRRSPMRMRLGGQRSGLPPRSGLAAHGHPRRHAETAMRTRASGTTAGVPRGWSSQGNAALGRALCHNPTALDHARGPRRSAVAFQATATYGSVADNQLLQSSAALELAAAFGCRTSVLTQSPDARENRAGKSYAAED